MIIARRISRRFARPTRQAKPGVAAHDAGRRPPDPRRRLPEAAARTQRPGLPARIGRGRRRPRALLDDRARSRPRLALPGRRRGARPQRARPRRARSPRRASAARQPARAHRARAPCRSRPTCRRWRRACSAISATTWCAQMERLPAPNPDALGVPDAVLIRPTVMVVFDAVRDEISLVTPCRPQAGASGEGRLRERARAASRTSPSRSSAPCRSRTATDPTSGRLRAAGLEHDAGRIPGDGRPGEGVHPRRRRLPGRALPALRDRVPASGLRALPLAPARQSGAVPLLPRLRGLPDRLLVARRSSCGSATAR